MLVSFFLILPRQPLRDAAKAREYQLLRADAEENETETESRGGGHDVTAVSATSGLLAPDAPVTSTVTSGGDREDDPWAKIVANLNRAKALVLPYMLPLFLVYIAEYIINQGVSPTLLFPLASTPFNELRDFYPMYGFLYQLGVFVSRSSIAFLRIHHLYLLSLLQVGNLALLTLATPSLTLFLVSTSSSSSSSGRVC
ncbi:hypothetical protein NPX13_g8918 [Xylaria arbuscula]|uniref:Protein BTN n=1 Tax=Xylaria arbuscula TaxID=114810 RepID=A0A9W8THZ3_9PEZI|nr:hypothetical protein NPX13_g8918 [Xylaria arbuscula]